MVYGRLTYVEHLKPKFYLILRTFGCESSANNFIRCLYSTAHFILTHNFLELGKIRVSKVQHKLSSPVNCSRIHPLTYCCYPILYRPQPIFKTINTILHSNLSSHTYVKKYLTIMVGIFNSLTHCIIVSNLSLEIVKENHTRTITTIHLITNKIKASNFLQFQLQEELGYKLHQVGTDGKVTARPLVRLGLQ